MIPFANLLYSFYSDIGFFLADGFMIFVSKHLTKLFSIQNHEFL